MFVKSVFTSWPAFDEVVPGVLNAANSSVWEGFVNCVPVESLVAFCDHALGYSTEKPFDVQAVSHIVKPGSGVGVSVGEGEGVGEGVDVGLGTVVGDGILVGVVFWFGVCVLPEALLRNR